MPALHAVVIGCGEYPSWPGANLESAAPSAQAFARFLREEFNHPECGFGSLRLLCSPEVPGADGPATMAAVKAAVQEWKAAASSDEDNIAVFYFCGHGIELGLRGSLLLRDFDKDSDEPWENAVDITAFTQGMERCKARYQLFVLDACRDLPSWLLGRQVPMLGRSLVAVDVEDRPSELPRHWPVLRAAAADGLAQGDPSGGVSYFTRALLTAFRGPASDDKFEEDRWEVRPDYILTSIQRLADERVIRMPSSPRQEGSTGSWVFHVPKAPEVPVIVGCDTANAVLVAGELRRATPEPGDWRLDLPPKQTRFAAEFGDGTPTREKTVRVCPPVKRVRL